MRFGRRMLAGPLLLPSLRWRAVYLLLVTPRPRRRCVVRSGRTFWTSCGHVLDVLWCLFWTSTRSTALHRLGVRIGRAGHRHAYEVFGAASGSWIDHVPQRPGIDEHLQVLTQHTLGSTTFLVVQVAEVLAETKGELFPATEPARFGVPGAHGHVREKLERLAGQVRPQRIDRFPVACPHHRSPFLRSSCRLERPNTRPPGASHVHPQPSVTRTPSTTWIWAPRRQWAS